ncbi:helix-turn-helix domain-containing protein [Streptomyces sp. TP-A0356]|uniref:helix-turn-helix domain-containing protein n=1 Tax=Streptomyces sp. TP-A0356 TaxID=1359208 RepID=UPI0006E40AC1|nr:helix-turn-helix domain-containing protein [Streptomyces sp. TP-A0356]
MIFAHRALGTFFQYGTNPQDPRKHPGTSAPEGELFHYTPAEAAQWLPFSYHKLRRMAFAREIPHVNNGNKIWLSGLNIRAITEQFTVQPFAPPQLGEGSVHAS